MHMDMNTATGTILRPGTFTAMDGKEIKVTAGMIKDIASGYDPQSFRAPLVHGHPDEEREAMGFVRKLSVDGKGHLQAQIETNDQLMGKLKARNLLAHSASLYPPAMPGNPNPEHWSLQHLGFLGSTPPAVKGLKPFRQVNLSAAMGGTVLKLGEPASFTHTDDSTATDTGETDMNRDDKQDGRDAELAGLRKERQGQATEIERLQARIATFEERDRKRLAEQDRTQALAFAEKMVDQGRTPAANRDKLTQLLVETQEQDRINGAGQDQGLATRMRALLEGAAPGGTLPTRFSESPTEGDSGRKEPSKAEIQKYVKDHAVSFSEAVKQLAGKDQPAQE